MERLVDLHIHSCASDGKWTGEEIVNLVRKKNITTFAVCDHDITDTIPVIEALVENDPEINYIKAVEIATTYEGREHHILAFNINVEDERLQQLIKFNRDQRIEFDYQLLKYLTPAYNQITYDDFESYEYDPNRGGWRMFCYLIDRQLIEDLADFFELIKGFTYKLIFKPADEVVSIINDLGAVPILAHPPAYTKGDLYDIHKMDYWRSIGIKGFECFTQYTKEQSNSQYYVDYCRKYNLFITGGSDCHGGFAGRKLGFPHVTEDMINLAW